MNVHKNVRLTPRGRELLIAVSRIDQHDDQGVLGRDCERTFSLCNHHLIPLFEKSPRVI